MNPGIHAAIAAAEERRRRQFEEEEERMTRYSSDDLEDWEFKIIRSSRPVFRRKDVLQRVLEEESIAGWQLLEKLDDNRIRLKRPTSARRRDPMLPQGIDPYRATVGGASGPLVALIAGLVVLMALGVLTMALGFRGNLLAGEISAILIGTIVLIGIIGIAVAAVKSRL